MMLKALKSLEIFFPTDFSQITVDVVTAEIFEVLWLSQDFSNFKMKHI